jgi:hypothetical protein
MLLEVLDWAQANGKRPLFTEDMHRNWNLARELIYEVNREGRPWNARYNIPANWRSSIFEDYPGGRMVPTSKEALRLLAVELYSAAQGIAEILLGRQQTEPLSPPFTPELMELSRVTWQRLAAVHAQVIIGSNGSWYTLMDERDVLARGLQSLHQALDNLDESRRHLAIMLLRGETVTSIGEALHESYDWVRLASGRLIADLHAAVGTERQK